METNDQDQNARKADDQQNENQQLQQEHSTQDVFADREQPDENSEQTPLAGAVDSDDADEPTFGSEGGSGWNNNKPGAASDEKDSNLIPVSDPENYTS